MAATVRITKVTHGLSGRVRISKVAFFGRPDGPAAYIRITRVGFVPPQEIVPVLVRIARVQFFARDIIGGTKLLVMFNGEEWQEAYGQIVMFNGSAWVPC
jgi:hypothetical protein